jgi:hypothetical protein
MTTPPPYRSLSLILFFTGFILIMIVAGIAIWADLEASLFESSQFAEEQLRTLRCPILITTGEEALVRASFTNPTDRPLILLVQIRTSRGFISLSREAQSRVELEPRETQQLEWRISPEDAVYGRFILVRINSLRTAPEPSRRASCGMMVIDAPNLTGNQIIALLLVGGLLAMGGGAALWLANNQPFPLEGRQREIAYLMGATAVIAFSALLAGFLGWWGLGLLIFCLALLLLGASFEHFVRS